MFLVGDFAVPVPRAWVEDVLKAAHFALAEDWEQVMDDVEGIWSVEEAMARSKGWTVADIGESSMVVHEA